MKLVGYARTSTTEQVAGLHGQIRDLTAAGCDVIYNEQVSSVGERPEFAAALADLEPGDTLVVTKMDRLARSISGLLNLVDDFNQKGYSLRILNMGGDVVDTRSATGRLMLSMLASFAQFEREIMLERQRDGIAKARAEGKYRGRMPIPAGKVADIVDLHAQGRPIASIAREVKVARDSVYKVLKERGISYGRAVEPEPRFRVPARSGGAKALAAAE